MRLAIVGLGAIGGFVYKKLCQDPDTWDVHAYDINPEKLSSVSSNRRLTEDRLWNEKFDAVVETASVQAVSNLAPKLLRSSPMLLLSVSALSDPGLLKELEAVCLQNNTYLYIPPGALTGVEAFLASRPILQSVSLRTRKNPRALGRQDEKETVVFQGKAREACEKFPKNLNIAATLSLYGIGFDHTNVSLISDPLVLTNVHEVRGSGSFGEIALKIESKPSPENPATSELTLTSVVASLDRLRKRQPLFHIPES